MDIQIYIYCFLSAWITGLGFYCYARIVAELRLDTQKKRHIYTTNRLNAKIVELEEAKWRNEMVSYTTLDFGVQPQILGMSINCEQIDYQLEMSYLEPVDIIKSKIKHNLNAIFSEKIIDDLVCSYDMINRRLDVKLFVCVPNHNSYNGMEKLTLNEALNKAIALTPKGTPDEY